MNTGRKPFMLSESNEPIESKASFNALGLVTKDQDKITHIPLNLIQKNENNKYSVINNQKMLELIDSIKTYGVMEPVIVIRTDNGFKLIAGERRLYASEQAGKDTIPAIIRDLNEEEEADFLVDTNNQREQTITEKAWGYRIKYDAERRRKGQRTDLMEDEGGNTLDRISSDSEDSRAKIARLIRITRLNDGLLYFVDEGRLPVMAADTLSKLSKEGQDTLLECLINNDKKKISMDDAEKLVELDKANELSLVSCQTLLFEKKQEVNDEDKEESKRKKRIERFNKVTKDCFPSDADEYVPFDKREVLVTKLVEGWIKKQRELKSDISEEEGDDLSEN